MKISFPSVAQLTQLPDLVRYSSQIFTSIQGVLSNGVSFSDNLDCNIVGVTFSVTGSDTAISHGLGRIPIGYFPVSLSAAMIVFTGTTPWNTNSLYLQSSVGGAAKLVIF